MGIIKQHEKIVVSWLREFAADRVNEHGTEYKVLVDSEAHQYQLLSMYWDVSKELVIQILFHFEIIKDGKVWILANNTDIPIAKELMKFGLTNTEIVLGFHPAELRQFSEFAVG